VGTTSSGVVGLAATVLTLAAAFFFDAQLGQVASFIQISVGESALPLDSWCSWWAWPAASVLVCWGTQGRFASRTEIVGVREHFAVMESGAGFWLVRSRGT
jgi:hypothetical protein